MSYEEFMALPVLGAMRPPTIPEANGMLLGLLGRRAVMRPIDEDAEEL